MKIDSQDINDLLIGLITTEEERLRTDFDNSDDYKFGFIYGIIKVIKEFNKFIKDNADA